MKNQDALTEQRMLIQHLVAALERGGAHVDVFETHISWVVVTDRVAYKFKKAVHFDFLDFSTLDARHYYCQEEVRLNRRLAPDLYLGIAHIIGNPQAPRIDEPGSTIEYAVKMRSFAQQALWNERIKMNRLSSAEIDALAEKMAHFHSTAAVAPKESIWGTPATIQRTAIDNLALITSLENAEKQKQQVREIESWQTTLHQQLNNAFEIRKANGMIRECHGDLHSGNILTIDDHVEVFDCIEFNEALRWIDVINDIAFICMDLQLQGRRELAARLLNRYLELSGDYDGLAVFNYYRTQRALVRCKVALMRARQLGSDAQEDFFEQQAAQYLAFSLDSIKPVPTPIIIMHGFSGSGKSTVAQQLIELTGAIRIRSDVERKRLHGLAATSRVGAAPDAALYSTAATQLTYDRLLQLAGQIVEAGMPVIVDAAFLKKAERDQFANLAHERNVRSLIVDVQASEAAMKERITRRMQMDHDPSDAGIDVLERQFIWNEPFAAEEMKDVIVIDTERNKENGDIRKVIATALAVG